MDDKNEARNAAPANEEQVRTENRRENEQTQVKSEQIRYENADEIYE